MRILTSPDHIGSGASATLYIECLEYIYIVLRYHTSCEYCSVKLIPEECGGPTDCHQ